jgi:hypothetical protein
LRRFTAAFSLFSKNRNLIAVFRFLPKSGDKSPQSKGSDFLHGNGPIGQGALLAPALAFVLEKAE